MRNVTRIVVKIKTRSLLSNFFFSSRKSCRLWDNVETIFYFRTGHRWQYSTCALHAW